MRTKKELYKEALRQIASRRQRAVTLATQRRQQVEAALPQLLSMEEQIRSLGFQSMTLAAKGAPSNQVQQVQQQRIQAQQQLDSLLKEHGYGPDSLTPKFVCSVCKDTGMVNGKLCSCVGTLARELRRKEISDESPLSLSSFDTMDFSYYPNSKDPATGDTIRQIMQENIAFLQEYTSHFDMKSVNLLLCGNAGLGKTHAALAVAQGVLDKGYNVVYISSQSLFSQLERERFLDSPPLLEAVLEADLLILDDLGTEYVNPYMLSCFYTLLNTRILEKRPTIYTTNIVDGKTFEVRYTEKISSRLAGSCEPVLFLGQDIRQLKNQ